jgi:PAS domain-containing protein
MYLLYVDESGDPNNVNENHFVLGGVAVFERQVYHLNEALNELQRQFFPTVTEPIEFHASDIYRRNKEPWHSLPRTKCEEIVQTIYRVIRDSNPIGVVLFSVVIDRGFQAVSDLVGRSFEELCNRFDLFLTRLHKEQNEQRGLIILDNSRYEDRLKQLLTIYRTTGTRFGTIYNLPESPMFTESSATRMLQLADFCSWAVFRRYERGDTSNLDTIINKFDNADGIIHGLVHLTTDRSCTCTYCLIRKLRPQTS